MNYWKQYLAAAMLLAVTVVGCGKGNSDTPAVPPPAVVNGQIVPNTGVGGTVPVGTYCYNGQCGACPVGYVQNSPTTCVSNGTSVPNSCPAGYVNYLGYCAPANYTCPYGTIRNEYGFCVYQYSPYSGNYSCKSYYWLGGMKICVYTW